MNIAYEFLDQYITTEMQHIYAAQHRKRIEKVLQKTNSEQETK